MRYARNNENGGSARRRAGARRDAINRQSADRPRTGDVPSDIMDAQPCAILPKYADHPVPKSSPGVQHIPKVCHRHESFQGVTSLASCSRRNAPPGKVPQSNSARSRITLRYLSPRYRLLRSASLPDRGFRSSMLGPCGGRQAQASG